MPFPIARGLVLIAGVIAVVATPAVAHVEPEVSEVPAGSAAIVPFTVEHGCEGSPTVELAFQVPDDAANVQPVDKDGWTSAVDDDVVTWSGGPLPADEEAAFEVAFTAPEDVGTVLTFP
jgi:uncharacterized protein YcnI